MTDAPRPLPEPSSFLPLPGRRASGAAAAPAPRARPASSRPAAGSQWGRTPSRGGQCGSGGRGPLPQRRLPARRRRRRSRQAHNVLGAQPAGRPVSPTPPGRSPRADPGAAPLCSRLASTSRPAPERPSPASTPTATCPPSPLQRQRGETPSSQGTASLRPRRAPGRHFSRCHCPTPRGELRPTATSPPLGAPRKFLIYFRL